MDTRQYLKIKCRSLKFKLLIAALVFSGFCANAQIPRIRTSAPKEKTAIKISDTAKSQEKTEVKKVDKSTPKAAVKASSSSTSSSSVSSAGGDSRYFALKTNLAYDVFAVLNIAGEISISNHFSAQLPVMWSLWDWKDSFGLRTVALRPGVRYYLKEVGSGHAFGVSADVAWFNFRYDEHRYQATGRPLLGVNIDYSYSLRLDDKWRLEFEIGVGYVTTSYNTYYNIDNGALINRRERNYFGPTNLGISLVYLIGK